MEDKIDKSQENWSRKKKVKIISIKYEKRDIITYPTESKDK